jgi:hypothetical protein
MFGKSPFVASPFDHNLAGLGLGLVGFLLHPIPRSGTWRRLMLSKQLNQPWRRASAAQQLGGRVDLEENCESTTPKYYRKTPIFSRR